MSASALTAKLESNWSWKQRNPEISSVLDELSLASGAFRGGDVKGILERWTPARVFPSEVHVELLKIGLIPDPYIGFNEDKLQWVGEQEWLYKCEFEPPSIDSRMKEIHHLLEFEGLDTVCDVYLNAKKILHTDNQFRTHSIPISSSSLKRSNTLLLHFTPASRLALARQDIYGKVRAGSVNLGDTSRVYVRKAQYDWRWDWGPEIMTVGPYRAITLTTYSARIVEVHARSLVSSSLEPSLKVDLSLAGTVEAAKAAHFLLRDLKDGRVVGSEDLTLPPGTTGKEANLRNILNWDLQNKVELWWPVGYGEQRLYELEVVLVGENSTLLSTHKQRIGFRSVSLVQKPLSEPDSYGTGTSFFFEVNGVPIFMGGSNWIPADNFLTTLGDERYKAWLVLLRDGGQNMVRLWGGGVYEPDVFYDTCDELGILVWQDFQFACGVYPANDEFVESVKKEAEDNVKRLRRHPSLALLCGNNEDYQQVLQWGGISELPARKIYEELLPEVVERFTDPEAPVPYHRGSPYGGKGWDTTDQTLGDVHVWDVWAGKERAWQDYDLMGGRFVSEFGLPAMPDMRTVEYWMQGVDAKQKYAQSKAMAQHTRAGSYERRFAIAMNENFRLTSDLETHAYSTQIMQSEAVSYAYRVWRRKWAGRGKEYTGGVLVWQLNDCWPVTSWAIADYFLRPKPVYFTIARELKPVTVGVFRTVIKNKTNDRPRQFYEFGAFRAVDASVEVWGTNSTLKSRKVTLELHCVDLNSAWTHKEAHSVVLQPNQATEILSISCPCPPSSSESTNATSHSVVVGARLVDTASGEILSRYADWPQPFKYVDFPGAGLKLSVDGEVVSLEVERPVKGLVLSVAGEGSEVTWSDNALDLLPGDRQVVTARGLDGRRLKVAYMGKERATFA